MRWEARACNAAPHRPLPLSCNADAHVGEARRTIGIAAVLRDGHRRAEHRAWSVHRTAGPPERVAIGLGCSKVSSGRVGLTLVRERQGF